MQNTHQNTHKQNKYIKLKQHTKQINRPYRKKERSTEVKMSPRRHAMNLNLYWVANALDHALWNLHKRLPNSPALQSTNEPLSI